MAVSDGVLLLIVFGAGLLWSRADLAADPHVMNVQAAQVMSRPNGGKVPRDEVQSVPESDDDIRPQAAATATESLAAEEITLTLPGGVKMVLVKIPAGSFQMGSPDTERGRWGGEDPVHSVTFSQPFYLGKTEVTQAQWQAVMGSNPDSSFSFGVGPTYPVFFVSWNDIAGAGGFIQKLNQYLGTTKFRLPSEAEWEYSARGGTATRFSFGDNLTCDDACGTCTLAAQYMWWCGNAGPSSHPVATKAANPFGLYDMHGNLGELVQDTDHPDYYGAPPDGSAWEAGGNGSRRVYRGSSWIDLAQYCRSAFRGSYWQDIPNTDLGFRLACDASSDPVIPPVISLMKKIAPPFKVVVTGSNLQSGIQIFLGADATPWSQVTWKKATKVVIGGGMALKAAVPQNTPTQFRFVNPDGGEATSTWQWP